MTDQNNLIARKSGLRASAHPAATNGALQLSRSNGARGKSKRPPRAKTKRRAREDAATPAFEATTKGLPALGTEPRTTMRQRSKEHSRRKLVQGTMQVLMSEGATALTTKRIATAAGMSQPSFYVHFNDMDDALRAVADDLSGKLREAMHTARLRVAASPTPESIRESYSTAVYGMLKNGPLTLLSLTYRHDTTTPLGRRLRELDREFRQDLKADLKRMGITDKVVRDLDVYVELIIGMTMSIVEGLLSKRLKDPERCITALSDAATGVFQALARNPQ